MINILIPEDIPNANKGEAALFFGIAKSLSIFGEYQISLFSLHPEGDRQAYHSYAEIIDANGIVPGHMLDGTGSFLHKIRNYLMFISKCAFFGLLYALMGGGTQRFMRHPVWQSCKDADIVLMCHDSFYAPLYHGPLILLFKLLGKPVMLYGGTILPPNASNSKLEFRLRNAFNRFVLKRADFITLREHQSFSYLKALGLKNIDVYPDLAFIAESAAHDEIKTIFSVENIPEGENLCGFAFSQKELDHAYPELPPAERRDRAVACLAAMMDFITEDLRMHAVFIPHAIGPTPRVDDRIAADWVRNRCQNKEKIHIIRNDYNQKQLRGMARALDLTVGMRLHFTIDALCHHVPSLLITHREEYRCHGIVGDMLAQAKYICNIEALTAADLKSTISDLWENRQKVTEDLADRIPSIMEATMGHASRAFDLLVHHRKMVE